MSDQPEMDAVGDQDSNQKPSAQQSGEKHDPQGPLCEYCPERLLMPDAKICSKCGNPQRGTQKPQDTPELSEHPLSDSPSGGTHVYAKPTPPIYEYNSEPKRIVTPVTNLSIPNNGQLTLRKVKITVCEAGLDDSRTQDPEDTSADSQSKLEQDQITSSEGDAAKVDKDNSDPLTSSGNLSYPPSPVC